MLWSVFEREISDHSGFCIGPSHLQPQPLSWEHPVSESYGTTICGLGSKPTCVMQVIRLSIVILGALRAALVEHLLHGDRAPASARDLGMDILKCMFIFWKQRRGIIAQNQQYCQAEWLVANQLLLSLFLSFPPQPYPHCCFQEASCLHSSSPWSLSPPSAVVQLRVAREGAFGVLRLSWLYLPNRSHVCVLLVYHAASSKMERRRCNNHDFLWRKCCLTVEYQKRRWRCWLCNVPQI